MNVCPSCGAYLPDGMTCRDLFLQVMEREYRTMTLRRDYLAARKLVELSYMLQHPHGYTHKELSLAARMLTLIIHEGYFPLDAAEILDTPFEEHFWQDNLTHCPLNIGNFRYEDEPFLDSAYRWATSVFDLLVCSQEMV